MTFAKLGDFLVLAPLLKTIAKNYPETIISVPDFLFPLFTEQKVFLKCLPNSECRNFSSSDFSILNLSFPLIPNLLTPHDHFKMRKECFQKPRHVFQCYEEALREYFPELPTDINATPYLDFDIDTNICQKWNVKPFEYFSVHSGSDFSPKNWDPENFENLIESILEQRLDLKCISLVGPSDQPLFSGKIPPSRFVTVDDSLRSVAHLLMGSLFHVDNDSGIHHLAGAMNVPSITIFGATGPGSWSSLTQRNFVHWGAPNCSHPCEGMKIVDCTDRVCLSSVKVEHLVESAQTILSAYSFS